MSHQLINLNADLTRLRNEGYAIEVKGSHLLVHDIPYVNQNREIKVGTLVSNLSLTGQHTCRPNTHIVHFMGEAPCHKDGRVIAQIAHSNNRQTLANGIVVDRSFSNKPAAGYPDFYEKMTSYARIISSPANSIDPMQSPRSYRLIEEKDDDNVFQYCDTASSRAGIAALSSKFETEKVAIIGLGGTGSYILDLVAKTCVQEVHIYDADRFHHHNAFRSPGAPSLSLLNEPPLKVDHFKSIYSNMHKHIVPHAYRIDDANIEELKSYSFAFVAIDNGATREMICDALETYDVPFIDCGIGVQLDNGQLAGVIRTTCSSEKMRDHIKINHRIPFADDNEINEYTQNIQIADLNSLNAVMAVLKWKKMREFYRDLEQEHHSTYTIDGNHLLNDDQYE